MIKKSLAFAVPAIMLGIAGAVIGCLSITQKPYFSIVLLFSSALVFILVERHEHEEKFHSGERLEIVDAKITIEGKRRARL